MGSEASLQFMWQVVVLFSSLDKLMPSAFLFVCGLLFFFVPFVAADAHSADKRTQDHSE